MKKLLAIVPLLAVVVNPPLQAQLPAQRAFTNLFSGDRGPVPRVDSIIDDWKSRFPTAESERDFKLLRQYRTEKQSLLSEYRAKEQPLRTLQEGASRYATQLNALDRELAGLLNHPGTDSSKVYIMFSLPIEYDEVLGADVSTPDSVTRAAVLRLRQRIGGELPLAKSRLEDADRALNQVTNGIQRLEYLLRRCETAIDMALTPEYKNMNFKMAVSGFFSLLIAVMIVSFFLVIYKKSDGGIATLLLSDGGLQFVTIFVLIIAIILFGILSILEGRELAAILSGIAGYILGRSSQLKAASETRQESTAAPPPGGNAGAERTGGTEPAHPGAIPVGRISGVEPSRT